MKRWWISAWVCATIATLASAIPALAQRRAEQAELQNNRVAAQPSNGFIPAVDLRVVIACADESERPVAQRLAQHLAPVADAIASGAKLTRADAARMGAPNANPDEIDCFRDWFLSNLLRHPGRGVYVFTVKHSPGTARFGATNCPPGCVPPDCHFCYELLDYEPVTLTPIDTTEPVFTLPSGLGGSGGSHGSGGSSGGSGGSGGGGGSGGSGGSGGGSGGSGGSGGPGRRSMPLDPRRPIVIIVLERPGESRSALETRIRHTLASLQEQPLAERLVIKVKSSRAGN